MSDPRRRWISATPSGSEACVGSVVHGAERHPVVVERRDRVPEREHLEAAGVREDRSAPPREGVHATEFLDEFLAGPEMEVVRVREHDVGAQRAHLVGVERLDRPLRPDGHERRCPDLAARRGEHAGTGRAVGRFDAEPHSTTIASPNE